MLIFAIFAIEIWKSEISKIDWLKNVRYHFQWDFLQSFITPRRTFLESYTKFSWTDFSIFWISYFHHFEMVIFDIRPFGSYFRCKTIKNMTSKREGEERVRLFLDPDTVTNFVYSFILVKRCTLRSLVSLLVGGWCAPAPFSPSPDKILFSHLYM